MTNSKIISIACVTGIVGDALLQVITGSSQVLSRSQVSMGGSSGWGLKPYFKQHGSAESLFIAGGMMTLFYIIYLFFFPLTWYYLAIYGIVLDYIFRKTMLFKSLAGYYNHLNYFWSAVWGAIPMLIPFAISIML